MKSDRASGDKMIWMIVDDDAGVRALLSAFAAPLTNAEVCGFSSPQEAMTAFAAMPECFQLVITDLEMPGMDGVQFCSRLRAMSSEIKVLLATGSQLLNPAAAMQKGFCGLLQKPFRRDALKTALAAAGIEAVVRDNASGVLTPT
jgi:CheY-like chemotaxis protein